MDKLFDELAKSLNVSTDLVQQFVGNYPQLRSQWQWYNLFDLWDNYLNFILLGLLCVMIYLGIKFHSDLEYSSEEEVNTIRKHWLKKLVPIVLVIVFFDIALNSLQTI